MNFILKKCVIPACPESVDSCIKVPIPDAPDLFGIAGMTKSGGASKSYNITIIQQDLFSFISGLPSI